MAGYGDVLSPGLRIHDRRSRGRRSDLLKVPNVSAVATACDKNGSNLNNTVSNVSGITNACNVNNESDNVNMNTNESNVSNMVNNVSTVATACDKNGSNLNTVSNVSGITNACNVNKESDNVITSANACQSNVRSNVNTAACSENNVISKSACNVPSVNNISNSTACNTGDVCEEIVEEGWANSVPDSVLGQISSCLLEDEIILSCVEDGQVVNSPLASCPSKRVVSEDSSDLVSGDWLEVLSNWGSRVKRVAVAGAEDRDGSLSADSRRSRSPLSLRGAARHSMPQRVGSSRPARK